MKKLTIIFTLLVVGLFAHSVFAQDQQKDKEMLIKAAKFLEEKPLDKDAKKIRSWAVTYIIQTDQVSVVLCGGELMEPVLSKKNKNSGDLISQYTIAMAAFKLANPDKKDDENAAQLAGIESALKAYQVMIAENPKTKFDGMDILLSKRDKGELKAAVEAANCAKKDK